MERYKAKEGKTVYYGFPGKMKTEDAVREANKKFKVNAAVLSVRTGYIWNDELFWNKPNTKAKAVLAVWKG